MTATVDVVVSDARPPAFVVWLTNLIMRPLLRTPMGRLVKPLALIEFTGRHSGTRRRVVVGWHRDGATANVLTPAPWRANFDNGRSATVYWCGHRSTVIGTLDQDPHRVAATANALLRAGGTARSLALQIPVGHTLTHTDIIHTNRSVIHFEPAETALPSTG